MTFRSFTALLIAVAVVSVLTPAITAVALEDPASAHVARVNGYDVDFTLPTAAKAGCLVCHGDPNLARLHEDGLVNYYVDGAQLEAGPHVGVQCAGCHLNFAFTAPHTAGTEDWEQVARSACKNCHTDQNRAYGAGVHRGEPANGETETAETPLCGDCHGGHALVALTENPQGQRQMHRDGWQICGRCHEDYWDTYSDYYHGRAFKRGAADAPACWDCHGFHDIYPSSDTRSAVHVNRLADTCGKCHTGDVNDGYLQYADLIHGKAATLEANPLYVLIQRVRTAIAGVFAG